MAIMTHTDNARGKIKEATGGLTGNDHFEAEGKAQRAPGRVRGGVDAVMDKVGDIIYTA